MQEYRSTAVTPTSTGLPGRAGVSDVLATNKVLRNTYALLALTLTFSAIMAGVSMAVGVPYGVSLMCSLAALALLWFVVPRTVNSASGIYVVFAVTGLLGFGVGPVISHYLTAFSNGPQIVMSSFGLTGLSFFGLSAYAISSQKDFTFMRGFLFSGILLAFGLGIVSLVAALLGYPMQPLALAVSGMFAVLMCAMILYQTGEIVNGGETNYINATVTLYLGIYNLFTSLLHLLGFGFGED